MGGSSVGRVIKFLGVVQQNWADQCEIFGGVWEPVSPPAGSGQSPGEGPGGKAPGSSWDFAFF